MIDSTLGVTEVTAIYVAQYDADSVKGWGLLLVGKGFTDGPSMTLIVFIMISLFNVTFMSIN